MACFFFSEPKCRQNWKFTWETKWEIKTNFQFWRTLASEKKKQGMELLQIFFWDSSKYSLLIKYNENTQKIRFTKRFNTKTSSKSPRKYCKRWKSAILEVFGGLPDFRALSKSNFWGVLALFFRKYTLERVFTKNLSKIYGLVFYVVPGLLPEPQNRFIYYQMSPSGASSAECRNKWDISNLNFCSKIHLKAFLKRFWCLKCVIDRFWALQEPPRA